MKKYCRKNTFLFAILLLIVSLPATAWAGPWDNKPSMQAPQSKAKIRIKGKKEIMKIPVFHIVQENCIFREAEAQPQKWTNPSYKQPQCISIRNERVSKYSQGKNPPAETKIFRVPANQYFKVKMTISEQMANRRGEQFGFQIVAAGNVNKTNLTYGGWKVGQTKTTKAIRLKPGKYYWRCPQNRTPWYGMIAE